MLTAPMLAVIEEAATGVLVLTETLEVEDFARSRLTRGEVIRQLHLMATTLAGLPAELRERLAEIDWTAWERLPARLTAADDLTTETAWFAARSLVPATLSWLRLYRRTEPDWFDFRL